jgi:hypothetical protein
MAEVHNLAAATTTLLERAAAAPAGQAALTLVLRETPGNLSGSGSETHQHFPPTGANCCQSLLLDPDARIGIDLHKRLFLLLTGRGE